MSGLLPQNLPPPRKPLVFCAAADSGKELISALIRKEPASDGPYRVAIVAGNEAELDERIGLAVARLSGLEIPRTEGLFAASEPITGDVAAIFTGVATAYPGMGYDLVQLMPEALAARAAAHAQLFAEYLQAIDPQSRAFASGVAQGLSGVMTATLQYAIASEVLALPIDTVLGVSMGEFSMLYATGQYDDWTAQYERIEESRMFDRLRNYSDSPFVTAPPGSVIPWDNWIFYQGNDEVAAVVDLYDDLEITTVASPKNCIIGGAAASCRELAERLPHIRSESINFGYAIHTRHSRMADDAIRYCVDLPVTGDVDVRMFGLAAARQVDPRSADWPRFLHQQLIEPIDAAAHVERAWAAGVRTFVEMGYRGWLTRSIRDTLRGRPHVAVATNRDDWPPLHQLAAAAAELFVHGVEGDLTAIAAPGSVLPRRYTGSGEAVRGRTRYGIST